MSNDKLFSFGIADLPCDLKTQIRVDLEQHCVTLVIAGKSSEFVTCAAVLVVSDGCYCLLTAKHVWQCIEKARLQHATADLQVMLGKSFLKVDSRLLCNSMSITDETVGPYGLPIPDLALIRLPTDTSTALSARSKTFYSLDNRNGNAAFTQFRPEGVFIAVGAPRKLVSVKQKQVRSLVFFTDVDEPLTIQDWDVIKVNLNREDNPVLPDTFGGMSGGGLWRVPISRNSADGKFLASPAILSGIIYGETELSDRALLVNGPKSIFRAVYAK
jgi:hypothetical protein